MPTVIKKGQMDVPGGNKTLGYIALGVTALGVVLTPWIDQWVVWMGMGIACVAAMAGRRGAAWLCVALGIVGYLVYSGGNADIPMGELVAQTSWVQVFEPIAAAVVLIWFIRVSREA